MAEVQAGCATAFGVLYRRYGGRAHGVARSVCRDHGRADEAVQEAFASIWKTRTSYERQAGKVAPWLLTIVRHRAIDVARRNGPYEMHRAGADYLSVLHAPGGVAEEVERRAVAHESRGFVDLLPHTQREAISLAFYRGLTHSEIAARLGVPVGTVKGRICLGLQRLGGDAAYVAA
jgi:RNA polymerase sigma-70 factor (ECF subfamily)